MALIPTNANTTAAEVTIQKLDLTTDSNVNTFTFAENSYLYLQNGETSAALTVNISGEGVTTFDPVYVDPVDVSAGDNVNVPNGDIVRVRLSRKRGYTGASGTTVTVTTTGATAGNSFTWIEG